MALKFVRRSFLFLNYLSRGNVLCQEKISNQICRLASSQSSPHTDDLKYLSRGDNKVIAYKSRVGKDPLLPGIIFCAGFQSNMHGVKATALDGYCEQNDLSFVRFDYLGVGDSSGDIREATITDWRADLLAVLDQLTAGPQILVGSSLGGLLMLHTYFERQHRIKALIGVSTAADIPDRFLSYWPRQILIGNDLGSLIAIHAAISRPNRMKCIVGVASAADMPDVLFQNYPGEVTETLKTEDEVRFESEDHHSYIITRKFVEDAKKHSILTMDRIPINCPVRLLHGMRDNTVPYQVSIDLATKLGGLNVNLLFRKNGDHRFSQPEDVTLLFEVLQCFVHGTKRVRDMALSSWQAFSVYSRPKEDSAGSE